MKSERVVIVQLRRPNRSDLEEMRSDPFWESGSFGITRCHGKNLMNPRNAAHLNGARFAFAQGGNAGTRLVLLTPPVTIVVHHGCIEAKWSPSRMPFRYLSAPVLVSNNGVSDFPALKKSLERGGRSTIEGQFSSAFRSRATPLEGVEAKEIIDRYEALRKAAPKSAIAGTYLDALPWLPPLPDRDREHTYEQFRLKVQGPPSARSETETRC